MIQNLRNVSLPNPYNYDCKDENVARYAFTMSQNPYDHIKVSVCLSCRNINKFNNIIEPLARESDITQDVEMIVKIDDAKNAADYEEVLKKYNISRYKILQYPAYYGRWSNMHFFNDMASMASGQIIWATSDDIVLQYGDWRKLS